jgi:membrane fusion protein (multidrug efflux system)
MVKPGTAVRLTVENQSDTFSAQVIAIAPSIDPNSRTLGMRARINNSNAELVPGAFARVELSLRQLENAFLIPSRAIVPELNAKKVFLIKNGIVTPTYIETRERTDDRVRVSSGLQTGDTLITAGILKVKPGQPVNVLEFE